MSSRTMSPAQVEREMERMNTIVRDAGHRFHKGAALAYQDEKLTGVDWNNPLDELIAREEQAMKDATLSAMEVLAGEGVELPLWFREKVKQAVFEEFQQYENALLEWMFQDSPRPIDVVRRVFAYAKKKRASLLWNAGYRTLGKLLKESHENIRLLTEALFGDVPVAWNKRDGAKEKMRASAKGNCNRRGGKKLKPIS